MSAAVKMPATVSRIAVLRANALGDYIFCIPALEALKHAWPDAELVYLGNAWHRDFIAGRPGPVDRVVTIPEYKGIPHGNDDGGDSHAVNQFFARMRAESFDLAFQMHGGGGHSNPFVRRLRARLSIGMQAENAPPLDVNIPYVPYHNEVLRYIEIAKVAGADPVTVEPHLAVTARDHHELHAALPDLRHPYVVLHPGASDARRRWSTARMAVIADMLAANGLHVYVTGVKEEEDICESLVGHARSTPTSVCARLSLSAMTALLAQAELVVSNDTGPLHLARALGTRTVGTYWVGNTINAGLVSCRGNRICMSWTTTCPQCGMDCIRHDAHVPRNGCDHAVSFLDSIAVEEVWSQVEALLACGSAVSSAAAAGVPG